MRPSFFLLAVLAGCGGASYGPGAFTRISQTFDEAHAKSWMAADAKKLDLLYVSDYETNDVDAFSYPGGKLEGVLKGVLRAFPLQTGLCSNAAGDVFIPDSSDSSVLVYAHAATKLSRRLLDLRQFPYSCAVDRGSGDLAVINLNLVARSGRRRDLRRCQRASETAYVWIRLHVLFRRLRLSRHLFVDATYDVPSVPFAFVELPKGSKSLGTVTLMKRPIAPGGVGWDGKHVVVGDVKSSRLYQFDISGSVGTETGSTQLAQARDVNQFVVIGASVAGASFKGKSVGLWTYPGGAPGKPIGGLGEPFGVTLSKASHT